MEIIGVSFGAPAKTSKWVENQQFGFEVWTDTEKVLADALGAGTGNTPRRVSVLLDAEGVVVLRYGEVAVGTHPGDVLEDAKKLFK